MRPAQLLLFAPLAALAAPLSPRQSENRTQSCAARSPTVSEWQLEDFDFHANYIFSTPSHQNSWGYVSFTLVNPVLGSSANCSGRSNRLSDFFYGEIEYECDNLEGALNGGSKFAFDRPSRDVKIEQTWECHDNPQFPPSRFTAKGDAVASLDCEENYWENANWTIGEIYSRRDVTCDLVDFSVPVKEIEGIARV